MILKAFLKLFLWGVSTTYGLAAGGFVMTAWVAVMNHLADDGPIFPAPMVAFVVVAPISFTISLIQGLVLAYEFFAGARLGNSLLWIGLAGGAVAGLIPYTLAMAPFQPNPLPAGLAFAMLGAFQGLVAFGTHRIANGATAFILRHKSSFGWSKDGQRE